MLVLQQLGRLRLYLLEGDQPVHQCRGDVEKGIIHHFQPVQCPSDCNADQPGSRLPASCPIPFPFILIGCILLMLCSVYVLRTRRCVNPALDQRSN